MSLLFAEPDEPYGRGRMASTRLLDEFDIDDGTLPEVLWRAAVLADEGGRPGGRAGWAAAVELLAAVQPLEDEA